MYFLKDWHNYYEDIKKKYKENHEKEQKSRDNKSDERTKPPKNVSLGIKNMRRPSDEIYEEDLSSR
jgi:hypothetical protein